MGFIADLIAPVTGLIGGGIAARGAKKASKEVEKIAAEQMAEANKLRQEALDTRVDYKTPAEIDAMIASAQKEAVSGSEYTRSVGEQVDKSLANQASRIERSATSGAQALAALGAGAEAGMEQMSAAERQQAELDQQKKQRLTQAQMVAAGYSDKEYDINVTKEFERLYGESEAMKGASIQNKAAAINLKAQGAAALGAGIAGAGALAAENIDFGSYKRGVQGSMVGYDEYGNKL